MIEVLVAEISLNDTTRLGIEWLLKASVDDADIRKISAEAENQVATQKLLLDNERNQKIWQQERILEAIDAIQQAVVHVATSYNFV